MQRYANWFRDSEGRGYPGAIVTVYVAGTITLADIYYAQGAVTAPNAKQNPFTTDSNGFFDFAAAGGSYDIVLSGSNVATTYLYNQALYDMVSDPNTNVLGLLQDASDVSHGDALTAVKQPITGAASRTQHQKNADIIHINDFGGDLKIALQNVPEYTTIVLGVGSYDITGLYSSDFNFGAGPFVGNTKKGIRLQGAGMPTLNSAGTALEGGTIIQGTLLNLADGFECYDLGIDCGTNVIATKYSGNYAEGFVPGCNTSYGVVQTTIKGVKVDRVISLGAAPTGSASSFKHTMLFENLEDCKIGQVEAVGGYHGFACKIVNGCADSITVRGGSAGNAFIFKSDVSNRCEDVQIGALRIDNWFLNGVEQKAGCLRYEAIDNVNGHITLKCKIGLLTLKNTANGVDGVVCNGTYPIVDCAIGHLDANIPYNNAAFRVGYSGSDVQRFVIGSHNIITNGRGFEIGSGFVQGFIGSGAQIFSSDCLQPLMTWDSSSSIHGNLQFTVNAPQTNTYMIQRNSGNINMDLIQFGGTSTITSARLISGFIGSLVLNSTNFQDSGLGAFATAGALYEPYKIRMKGAVKAKVAGSPLVIGTITPSPLKTQRFPVHSQTSGGSLITVAIEISDAGVITCLNTIAINDYIFLDSVFIDCLSQ
jgi:hypothetical protein